MGFEEVCHTADIALRAWGTSLEELFQSAAAGMFTTMGAQGYGDVQRHVSLQTEDLESLLVDWLSELLYLSETRGELYTEFEVQVEPTWRLAGEVRGYAGRATGDRIKAVTYHGLSVERVSEGYTAVIVFDT